VLRLARYLGFSPSDNYSGTDHFFDYHAGTFVSAPPLHKKYLDSVLSEILHVFLSSDYEKCMLIPLNSATRVLLLSKLLDYYDFHFERAGKILSLQVLKEVYHF